MIWLEGGPALREDGSAPVIEEQEQHTVSNRKYKQLLVVIVICPCINHH